MKSNDSPDGWCGSSFGEVRCRFSRLCFSIGLFGARGGTARWAGCDMTGDGESVPLVKKAMDRPVDQFERWLVSAQISN